MTLDAGFLEIAIRHLQENADVAGVGGTIREMEITNREFLERSLRQEPHMRSGDVDRLNGGALYRREAIVEVGFLSDRNLHAYEEFDLGARLIARNWRLVRLNRHAVAHFAHRLTSYDLLWYRLRSKYAFGSGELVRGAVGNAHWRQVLFGFRELRIWIAVLVWWASMVLCLAVASRNSGALQAAAMVAVLPLIVMTMRKRSVYAGLYAVASWNVYATGMVLGVIRPRTSPLRRIHSVVLRDPGSPLPESA
jgi:hypothetical protein